MAESRPCDSAIVPKTAGSLCEAARVTSRAECCPNPHSAGGSQPAVAIARNRDKAIRYVELGQWIV